MSFSTDRRSFIKTMTAGAAGVILSSVFTTGCREKRVRYPIGISPSGFVLSGREYPIFSGSFDYWSAPKDKWEDILKHIARMGINTVQTSVPWSLHETGKGHIDFSGPKKNCNLADFIDTAADNNLKLILDIGPIFSRLLQDWAIPARLQRDDKYLLKNSSGSVEMVHNAGFWSAVPSLSSESFQQEYLVYLQKLSAYIEDYLYTLTEGPVIALRLSSPINSHCGKIIEAFDSDYSRDVADAYITWLKNKYKNDLSLLNETYTTGYRDFTSILPPDSYLAESMDQLPPYFDWVRFGVWKKERFLEFVLKRLEEYGVLGLPVFASENGQQVDVNRDEKSLVNKNISLASVGFPFVDSSLDRIEKVSNLISSSAELPYCDSLPSGKYACAGTGKKSGTDWEFNFLYGMMNGVRAINSDRLVDYSYWHGCQLSNSGKTRQETYDMTGRLLRFIRESRLYRFAPVQKIAVLENTALQLIEKAKKISESSIPILDKGLFEEPVDYGFDFSPEECRTWHYQMSEMLDEIGFEWIQAGRAVDIAEPSKYKVIILPSTDFVFEKDIDCLKRYINSGGIVLYGPGRPYLDEDLRLSKKVAEFFAGSVVPSAVFADNEYSPDSLSDGLKMANNNLVHISNPLDFPDLLNEFESGPKFSRNNRSIELCEHILDDRRILYAANTDSREVRCDIFFPGKLGFRGLWRAEDKNDALGKITVTMPPVSVSIWEVDA